MSTRWLVRLTLLLGLGLGGAIDRAWARPGGGESYSGGGGHSSGGGGGGGGGWSGGGSSSGGGGWGGGSSYRGTTHWGGDGGAEIGPFIVLIVIAVLFVILHYHGKRDTWMTGARLRLSPRVSPQQLRQRDPNFSSALFEDFVYHLYAAAHRVRPNQLAKLAPYASQAARAALAARVPAEPALSVVVGALRVVGVHLGQPPQDDAAPASHHSITVEIESNLAFAKQTLFVIERWRLIRDVRTASKPPGPDRVYNCPNCGAPWESQAIGSLLCQFCAQVVDNGRFDWCLSDVAVTSETPQAPTLTAEVPERGTELPSYVDANLPGNLAALQNSDPNFSKETFVKRVHHVFTEINHHWSNGDISPTRVLLTTGLYDYFQYWLDAYALQGLRNQLLDMRITNTQVVRLERDQYFDAMTVRVWATGKDFVVNAKTGQHVRGSKSRDRAYSEYWTFVRGRSVTGVAKASSACPSCGATMSIGQAGECSHCHAHVTRGEFDWTLSKIEQDDSYRG